MLLVFLPSEKERPRKMPNRLIEMTTSILAAPTISVGIPLSFPYPMLCRWRVVGTTTAGEMAATVYLRVGMVGGGGGEGGREGGREGGKWREIES